MELPEITEAKRLTLRPGDTLAVRLDHEPNEYEVDEMTARLRELTGVPVLFLGPGTDVEVIAAPQPDGA